MPHLNILASQAMPGETFERLMKPREMKESFAPISERWCCWKQGRLSAGLEAYDAQPAFTAEVESILIGQAD